VNLTDRLVRLAPYTMVRGFELLLSLRRDPLLGVIDEFVAPGHMAVDIGAHRGWYTRRLAVRTGDAGRVHAIEPNIDSVHVLEAVARHHPNVTIHHLAVSDRPGTGRLLRPFIDGRRTDAMGSLSNPGIAATPHDVLDVPMSRLDDVLADQIDRVAFIKCDVEGHEHEVLVGSDHVIRENRPVILVEIEQRHRVRPIGETFDWLAERGYDGHYFVRDRRKHLAEFDVERDQLRYVRSPLEPGRPHPDYVSDFLFVPARPRDSSR
jgi:FkbM family methyltransferase